MAKKKRRPEPGGNAVKASAGAAGGVLAPVGRPAGSKYAVYVWGAAFLLVIGGYFMLRLADPGGRNGWSVAAPTFLLAGYLLFIPAISLSFRD
jgi:hypothetical protein